jgi:hypothetical protein
MKDYADTRYHNSTKKYDMALKLINTENQKNWFIRKIICGGLVQVGGWGDLL